jgi:hypothetical protein
MLENNVQFKKRTKPVMYAVYFAIVCFIFFVGAYFQKEATFFKLDEKPTSPTNTTAATTPSTSPAPSLTPKPTTTRPTVTPATRFADGYTPVNTVGIKADKGKITAPFVKNSDGTISQNVETSAPTAGGRAAYGVYVPTSGDYSIKIRLSAGGASADSIFVDVNNDPAAAALWNAGTTNGFEERIVSWQGNGTVAQPQFKDKTFTLLAGYNEIVLRGRDAGLVIDTITLERK